MIQATWVGGPFDGRTDVLPDGVQEVSVAVPNGYGLDPFWDEETPLAYRECRCEVIADIKHLRYLILWHEPQ